MKILITGIEGFVGSNLAKQIYREHEIIGLDYLTNRKKTNIPKEIKYINQDLSKINISELPKVDLVIHLAAITIERISETPHYKNINLSAMNNVLKYTLKHKTDLIFSSSGSVYGSGTNFTEEAPLNPLSDYSKTKILEENHAAVYSENYDLNVTILRYSNCYGDTTYIKNKAYPGKKGVIRIFTEKAVIGEALPIIRNQSRDFTFIDDVVSATKSVIGLQGFNLFNVGTGIETKIEAIPDLIGQAFDKQLTVVTTPPRKIDNLTQRTLNINKISRLWKPKHSLREGIGLYVKQLQEKQK